MMTANHLQAGDAMQSALSRLAEFVLQEAVERVNNPVPYEVRMAALEGQTAVNDWTAIRRTDR